MKKCQELIDKVSEFEHFKVKEMQINTLIGYCKGKEI